MPNWFFPAWITTSSPTTATTSATVVTGSALYTSIYNTATTTPIWATNQNVWWSNAQTSTSAWYDDEQQLAQQHAQTQLAHQQAYYQQRHWQEFFGTYRAGLHRLSAPAIITHQEQTRRDEELYRRALGEHNEQEAQRLLRQIEHRNLAQAEQLRLQAEAQHRNHEDQQRRTAANDRARELLLEHLTPEQRDTFTKRGFFVVEGGKSGTRYRINGNTLVANVDVLRGHNKMVTHRLCAHAPSGSVPMGDQLLAQKIMLELDEDAFLRVANRHG